MSEIKPVAWRCVWITAEGECEWWQYHDAFDPLPSVWDEAPDEVHAYYDQQAIDTLRAEVEAHKLNIDLIKECAAGSLNVGRGLISEYAVRAERAEAEAEALRKDAERYRWLRENGKAAATGLVMRRPETWDAAIDAAKQAQP